MRTTAVFALVANTLLLAALLNSSVLVAQEQESIESPESAVVDTEEVQVFRDALANIERHQGAYGAGLPEQLISLGLALQSQNRHKEAVTVFKRGVHLARINSGLYSAEQIPFIQGEISSNLAIGELDEADDRQNYLLKVQRRSLASGELYIQALMQQAAWQHQAFEMGVGDKEFIFGRLLSMWDLYRLAINDIVNREGAISPRLLPPLHGMLKAQYLISAFQSDFSNDGNYSTQSRYRADAYISQNYKKGDAVIRAIYNVEQNRDAENGLPAVETLVMLGDWMLWHGKRDSANQIYLTAIRELAELNDAQIQIKYVFGEAVALPDIDGIRPLPPAVAADQGDILLEFKVNPRGHIIDLVRLDEGDSVEANRLMRKLRKTTFRLHYASGEPVITEKIVRAYDIVQ